MKKQYVVGLDSKGNWEIQKVSKAKAAAMAITGKAYIVDKSLVRKSK